MKKLLKIFGIALGIFALFRKDETDYGGEYIGPVPRQDETKPEYFERMLNA